LNLENKPALIPEGSLVTVNNLVNYDARIDPDMDHLLTDAKDDDGDGQIDEPDEINMARDWEARILLTQDAPHPGAPYEVTDNPTSWMSRTMKTLTKTRM
jgi:hypothetical protein